MDTLVNDCLLKLEFGEIQRFKNIGIIPLFTLPNHGPEYLTLKDALDKKLITITEINKGGSVPELKAVNKAETPILLLDGEELAGAKQNRVLNSTILLKENSETIIPVSCTEQDRWSYVSDEFDDSGHIMSRKLRVDKTCSVSESLNRFEEFEADQGAVWDGIDEMRASAKAHSATNAMRDIFESRANDLNECLEAFECLPSQKGLLVFIDGEVAGLDLVSLESAYKVLHHKLVKSYVMDVLLQKEKKNVLSLNEAKDFLKEARTCNESKYKSVGYGWDYRYEGLAITGSALVSHDAVIHTAFFKIAGISEEDRMAGYRRRSTFRGYPNNDSF